MERHTQEECVAGICILVVGGSDGMPTSTS
jgi:hypothetical protein